jgi:hypothetical protein
VKKRLKILAASSSGRPTIVGMNLHAQNCFSNRFRKNSAGEFMMGCSSGDSSCGADENPRHRVPNHEKLSK